MVAAGASSVLNPTTFSLAPVVAALDAASNTTTTDDVPPGSIAIGIFFVVLGAVGNSVGMILWKWSNETETHLPLLRRPRWWLGFFFALIVLFASDAVSYAVLPLALIAPFGGLPIIITAMLAATGLIGVREPVELVDGVALLATFAGTTTISVVTVSTGYAELTLETLRIQTLEDPLFIATAATAMALSWTWIVLHSVSSLRAVTIDAWTSNGAAWPMLVSALLASLNAGAQQVFMKVISEVFHELTEGVPAATLAADWATWVGAVGLCTFGPTSVVVLQLLLGPGRALSLAVPAYQAFTVCITTAVGAYFLHELAVPASDPAALVAFGIGLVLVLVGLVTLSYRQEVRRHQREAESNRREEAAASKKADGGG